MYPSDFNFCIRWDLQAHIRVLEPKPDDRSAPDNTAALLLGLEYLIGISYEDTEVFNVSYGISYTSFDFQLDIITLPTLFDVCLSQTIRFVWTIGTH